MKEYLLQPSEGSDIKFIGKEVKRISSRDYMDTAPSRWTELVVYQTRGGNYVSETIGRSIVPGEVDRSSAASTPTKEDVRKFFGDRWLAKYLYDDLGWDFIETVE